MRIAPTRMVFRRWSCSAATRASARRASSSTRGSCAQTLHERGHGLALGGWANPHAILNVRSIISRRQNFNAEFFLTQVVSHHDANRCRRFVDTTERRGVTLPACSASSSIAAPTPGTLEALRAFCRCRSKGSTREFAAGATAEDVCAQTIRTLINAGARHFYISNLPIARAQRVLASIMRRSR